jgi:hypothetical protein
MIIVSQDKKAIHNFDNVLSIQVEEINGGYELIVYDAINDGTGIGTYKTEERAKDILQEIVKEYKATEAFKVCANIISDKVGAIAIEEGFAYEMPLE